MMKNAIKKILSGENSESILNETIDKIYKEGPVNISDMEILAYYATYKPQLLESKLDTLLLYMGMYYKVKNTKAQTLPELVQTIYRDIIKEKWNEYYTPVQSNIVSSIKKNICYSFSAPTSTGKSFIFRNLIIEAAKDVVIFVPSRALINEYFLFLTKEIPDKKINILTFVDKLNTSKAVRNVFILTPERSCDLFKRHSEFDVEYILFDEAQLGSEESMRGMYFDSVVRRSCKYYPDSKIIFAQPFVSNPGAQIKKNSIDESTSDFFSFSQRNVGQLFYAYDCKSKLFYHFGVNKSVMGNSKIKIECDPISLTLKSGGSVLFYTSKSKIIKNNIFEKYKIYVDMCCDIDDVQLKPYLDRMKVCTGANTDKNGLYYSSSLAMLKKGVVVHHGSLPLKVRSIIEDFIKAGLCRICFATSTVEQGVNMPFDLIYITYFERKKPLAIKNLIGRAGRATSERKFDVGKVVVNSNNITSFRNIMNESCELQESSLIDIPDPKLGKDFDSFRESIINGTYNEEYNMTPSQLNIVNKNEIQNKITELVEQIVDSNGKLYNHEKVLTNSNVFIILSQIYESHLNRELNEAEKSVLQNALHILFYRMYFRTFSSICKLRYNHLCQVKKRKEMYKNGQNISNVKVRFVQGYSDLPKSGLRKFPLVDCSTNANNVDFDTIIYDTYDYLDKLIGFKLSDIYYAALKINYEKTGNPKSLQFAKLIKYGTSNEKEIYMLRYGLSFEDINILSSYIEKIDEEGIVVNQDFYKLPESQQGPLLRFL